MRFTLFYSWQSDLPSGKNRSLIRSAAEAALVSLGSESAPQDAPRLDSDTADVPGMPEIARTILEKVKSSDAFLADVSLVEGVSCTPPSDRKPRPTPNPNVLIELGFAAGTIGWERLICVMNTDYGDPTLLPFDLKHRRWPITYSGSDGKARQQLTRDLEAALKSITLSDSFTEKHNDQPYGVDPLDRIIAHRLRDAIANARYPIATYISHNVDPNRLDELNLVLHSRPSNVPGSEFPPPDLVRPVVEVLATPPLFHLCNAPRAPRGLTWLQWIIAGMNICEAQCDEALQRYASRGPRNLVAELEDVKRRMTMAAEPLAKLAAMPRERVAPTSCTPWFEMTLLLILRAERTWVKSLTKTA